MLHGVVRGRIISGAMKILSYSKENIEKTVDILARCIEQGGIAVVPTDTVYGIIGRADSEEVIHKVLTIKGRSYEKAFPVFVKDIPAARRFAYIADAKATFLASVWPGPVTVVFHHKEKLPPLLTCGRLTIGIRIPNHSLLLSLLSRIDIPLLQTSANISGKSPAGTTQDIKAYFGEKEIQPDFVIDGGEVAGMQSTVVDFTQSELRVVRSGVVTKDELDRFFGSMR